MADRMMHFMLDADAAVAVDEIKACTTAVADEEVIQHALGIYWNLVKAIKADPELKLVLIDTRGQGHHISIPALEPILNNAEKLIPNKGQMH